MSDRTKLLFRGATYSVPKFTKRALQVLIAVGPPGHKYRESKNGQDTEDWIYGTPPGKITFVTFANNKVIKVRDQYAGLGGDVPRQ